MSRATATASRAERPGSSSRAVEDKPKSVFREYGEALFVALLLALFIRSFVVQAFKIPSGSMLPTLQIGDHILVNKFAYGVRLPIVDALLLKVSQPHRGDVIVFIYPEDPDKDFIKRVVGVAGDTIEVRSKRLYVNGELVVDPHEYHAEGLEGRSASSPRDTFGPVTVPADSVFVMGDNRDRSYDSRYWGPVTLDKVKGKAFLIYFSWDPVQLWNPLAWGIRWGRIGDLIF
jgi:signal peptidase I